MATVKQVVSLMRAKAKGLTAELAIALAECEEVKKGKLPGSEEYRAAYENIGNHFLSAQPYSEFVIALTKNPELSSAEAASLARSTAVEKISKAAAMDKDLNDLLAKALLDPLTLVPDNWRDIVAVNAAAAAEEYDKLIKLNLLDIPD